MGDRDRKHRAKGVEPREQLDVGGDDQADREQPQRIGVRIAGGARAEAAALDGTNLIRDEHIRAVAIKGSPERRQLLG